MQPSKNDNFMDPKTLIAIILVGVVWIGWQNFLQEKYPEAYKQQQQQMVAESAGNEATKVDAKTTVENKETTNEKAEVKTVSEKYEETVEVAEKTINYSDATWDLSFSSKGLGLKKIELKNYTDREDQLVQVGSYEGFLPFETNIIGRRKAIDFQVTQSTPTEIRGVARVDGVEIIKTIEIDSTNYSLKTKIQVNGVSDRFSGLVTYTSEKLQEMETSLLMPVFNPQEVVVAHGSTSDREYLMPQEPYQGAFSQVQFFSLGTSYFTSTIIDHSDVLPDLNVKVDPTNATAFGVLTHSVLNRSNQFNVAYTAYAGPKDLTILKQIDPRLSEVIDFGWFSWLAVILFDIMKWFYGIFGNYGIAIILLTLLVRTVVLPFNLMSYKSMKSMQVIQPQIKALREKYKGDQQQLNTEMMALMKENKVNPMGGCLPMLLQFPVFIALYRVFGQSIDLYKQPFALWIHDLSMKDPYYILPVLMAATFYFQTKLTPTTMDPTQQKVMMIMPVMFAFFMAGLPSALTLYMFVSTLFGIVQQLYFMKDRKVTVPASVKA